MMAVIIVLRYSLRSGDKKKSVALKRKDSPLLRPRGGGGGGAITEARVTLREYEAIVSKRTVQNCRRVRFSYLYISSVHYFLHFNIRQRRWGLYMARHHMAGTSRPIDTYVNFPLFAIPTRRFLSTERIEGRRARARASFGETKKEGQSKRKYSKEIMRKSVRMSSPRRERDHPRRHDRELGSRLGDFTAFRQSAGTKWPIVARLKRRTEPASAGPGDQPSFFLRGRSFYR